MPALVKYIEQLTKWYVRLNRSELKGSEGVEDVSTIYFSSSISGSFFLTRLPHRLKSIVDLYDVLLTLARLMAPFTPFFAEYLYQNLRILGG